MKFPFYIKKRKGRGLWIARNATSEQNQCVMCNFRLHICEGLV